MSFDVIIMGARCAGASLATLLAQGHRAAEYGRAMKSRMGLLRETTSTAGTARTH